jgi:hypothetical protein
MSLRSRYSVPDDPSDQNIFDDVQQDGDICNNCFRRTHQTFERNYVIKTFEDELWAKQIDASPRSFSLPHQTTYVPGVNASEGTYTYCKCGSHAALRPVPKQKAMEHAKRLYDRLEEMGAGADKNVLLDEVRERMSEPENQGRFDTVLKEAVGVAQCSNGSEA